MDIVNPLEPGGQTAVVETLGQDSGSPRPIDVFVIFAIAPVDECNRTCQVHEKPRTRLKLVQPRHRPETHCGVILLRHRPRPITVSEVSR